MEYSSLIFSFACVLLYVKTGGLFVVFQVDTERKCLFTSIFIKKPREMGLNSTPFYIHHFLLAEIHSNLLWNWEACSQQSLIDCSGVTISVFIYLRLFCQSINRFMITSKHALPKILQIRWVNRSSSILPLILLRLTQL